MLSLLSCDDAPFECFSRAVEQLERFLATRAVADFFLPEQIGAVRLILPPEKAGPLLARLERLKQLEIMAPVFQRASANAKNSFFQLEAGDETWHPRVDQQRLRSQIPHVHAGDLHLKPCLRGDFSEAWRLADNDELREEDVCVTLAVLGEIETALTYAEELPDFRKLNVAQVCAIEAYRRHEVEKAQHILEILLPQPNWFYLGVGLAGRAPWMSYPYPDW